MNGAGSKLEDTRCGEVDASCGPCGHSLGKYVVLSHRVTTLAGLAPTHHSANNNYFQTHFWIGKYSPDPPQRGN